MQCERWMNANISLNWNRYLKQKKQKKKQQP